jgi:hypothetical protein
MKTRIVLLIIVFQFFNACALKKLNYAKIKIEVPSNYKLSSEYQIENDNFSAQWTYLPGKSFSNNMQIEMNNQFESQFKLRYIEDINFISCGEKFIGKKYYLENAPLKYRIYAYGIINKKLVILNLGFKNNPENDKYFDDLMRKFITF